MTDIQTFIRDHALDTMRIAGRKVGADRERTHGTSRVIEVFNPYSGARIGISLGALAIIIFSLIRSRRKATALI